MSAKGLPVLATLLWCAACGEGAPALSTRLSVDAALHAETQRLRLYAFGPRMSNDLFLPCSELLNQNVDPEGDAVHLMAQVVAQAPFDGAPIALEEVSAGDNRLVFVAADDSGGTVIGVGCQGGVDVPEGGSVNVEVHVFPLP